MKKTLLILMIACSAFAQNNSKWADSAAVWHYTYNFAGVGYARYSYVSDTLLQGKMCQKIIEQTQVKIQTSPGIFMLQPVYSGATMYVYKSNDSVFTYRNNNFYLRFLNQIRIAAPPILPGLSQNAPASPPDPPIRPRFG